MTVRRPHIRQPCSTEFVSAWEVWLEVRIGSAINRPTILRKQQCFREQRVPRCVLGDFFLFYTCILHVMKWEP